MNLSDTPFRWLSTPAAPDTHAAFRLAFSLERAASVEARILGASWFGVWLDGAWEFDGPTRFAASHPEWQIARWNLPAGRHVVAARVHFNGLDMRLMLDLPPFFACELECEGRLVVADWKCCELQGFEPQTRRVNPQLGWIEWCDTARLPRDEHNHDWHELDFDDSAWSAPVVVAPPIGAVEEPSIALVPTRSRSMRTVAQGALVETFGYPRDDPPARFLLRELQADALPASAVWHRFDLERVRLGRAEVTVDAPPGTQIEIAQAESLWQGRVAPYITLSAGASCHLDHFKARGGQQTIAPLEPRAGRWVEVHLLPPSNCDADSARILDARWLERAYYDEAQGAFECDDARLNAIWQVGVETIRACVEDAPVDNPTRERGAWTGDLCTVLESAACAFADLRPFRRGLVLAARCADERGLVAGLCPGQGAVMPTYAALWLEACWRYAEVSGDDSLLHELREPAQKCVALFESHLTAHGIADARLGWSFVDWGHAPDGGPNGDCDLAANLLLLRGLRAWEKWTRHLDGARAENDETLATRLASRLQTRLAALHDSGDAMSYHVAALGTNLGDEDAPLRRVRAQWETGFPSNANAPRQSGPDVSDARLVTPYFAHFAFPPLLERGHDAWVWARIADDWGWMLDQGATTWWEVFDSRWSRCHAWSGAPTWLLSRYALGLHPRFASGANRFRLKLRAGELRWARGRVLLPSGEVARVEWERHDASDSVRYQVRAPEPLQIKIGETTHDVRADQNFEFTI